MKIIENIFVDAISINIQ